MVSQKRIFLLIALGVVLTSCATSAALQPDNKNLQQRETTNKPESNQESNSPQYKFPSKSEIPGFLKDKRDFCKNCYIGISDPGLDSSTAVDQALQRAAVMEALTAKTKIHFITDFYTKSIHGKKWEVFAHLFEMVVQVKTMKPDTVFFSKYDEAIVMAKPGRNILPEKKRIVLSGFIQEKIYSNLADYIYRFEMKTASESLFLVRIVNDNYSVESLQGETAKAHYPKKNYSYASNISNDSTWNSNGLSLCSALWPAYFGGTLKSIFYQVKETAEYEVGNMRDTFSEELNARLKRQTGNNTFTVGVEGCEIYNNHLTPLIQSTIKK